ncbi:MAG: aminotransferase class III-fold pyridoxal phosphate-dependent enzyme, partial [Mesorhizobium sp.]|uniref:aminotransferase class III-fold pyridoxal phosphate-dependent enzyme n=1 Tax=Mesorhizobium sp. TaxID=1871066 RepID=UPI000FE8F43D
MPDDNRTLKNRTLKDVDKQSLIHPYTNLADHQRAGPLIIERGEGIHVIDENGKRYIEGLAGLWSTALGFSEPELAVAAAEQFGKLPTYHSFSGAATRPMIELADRLKDMVPISDGRVFFANSGSEINDTVIKLIWYANNILDRPEKKKVITRKRSYHGVTLATASMTGME